MIQEEIKIEFRKQIEAIIDQKRQEINKLSDLQKIYAKIKHLDDLNNFAKKMNTIINEILQKTLRNLKVKMILINFQITLNQPLRNFI